MKIKSFNFFPQSYNFFISIISKEIWCIYAQITNQSQKIEFTCLICLSPHLNINLISILIFSKKEQMEWRLARFGLVAPWVKELKKVHNTYNARTETVHEKLSFRNAWKKNQFCLLSADVIFEPKYINNKPEWWGIHRKDDMPFAIAGIYEYAVVNGEEIRSMSMLTINSDHHPFMKQFHAPTDEKRSIIVIPPELRNDWLHCKHEKECLMKAMDGIHSKFGKKKLVSDLVLYLIETGR